MSAYEIQAKPLALGITMFYLCRSKKLKIILGISFKGFS